MCIKGELPMEERNVWFNIAMYWLVEELKNSAGLTFMELLCHRPKLLPVYSIYIAFDKLLTGGTVVRTVSEEEPGLPTYSLIV
jgi:hypothetical protein